eukprot:3689329-Amphidinium_carterae.1
MIYKFLSRNTPWLLWKARRNAYQVGDNCQQKVPLDFGMKTDTVLRVKKGTTEECCGAASTTPKVLDRVSTWNSEIQRATSIKVYMPMHK